MRPPNPEATRPGALLTRSSPVARSRRTISAPVAGKRGYSISVAETKRPPGIASAQTTFGARGSRASNTPTTPSGAPIGFASARTGTVRTIGHETLTEGSESGVRVAVGSGVAGLGVKVSVAGERVAGDATTLGELLAGVSDGD